MQGNRFGFQREEGQDTGEGRRGAIKVRAKDLPCSLRCVRRCFLGPRAGFAELTAALRRWIFLRSCGNGRYERSFAGERITKPQWISARSCGACERSSTLPAPGRRANLSFAEVDLGSLLCLMVALEDRSPALRRALDCRFAAVDLPSLLRKRSLRKIFRRREDHKAAVDLGSLLRERSLRKIVRPRKGASGVDFRRRAMDLRSFLRKGALRNILHPR